MSARGKKTDRPYSGPRPGSGNARLPDDGDDRLVGDEEFKEKRYRQQEDMQQLARAEEDSTIALIDDVHEFMRFREKILPALRQDIESGLAADEILAKYASVAAAKGVMNAIFTEDPGKSQAAIKDLLDRVQGKAVERREVRHEFEELEDEQLDAILFSKIKEVEVVDEDEGDDD